MAKSTHPLKRPDPAKPTDQPRGMLLGSGKAPFATDVPTKPASKTTKVTVSLILKRKAPLQKSGRSGSSGGPVRVSRAEYKRSHGADPAAMKLVMQFAREFNLTAEADPSAALRRTMRLTGTIADLERAFAVTLLQKDVDGAKFRVREGMISLPAPLLNVVEAVLGLDNRPQATAKFRTMRPNAQGTSFTPPQVAQIYQFPATASGAGQTIGIIELGGGYRTADLKAYFASIGVPNPTVTAVSVDQGKNAPTTASGADGEVMLDIEVAASVAPGAKVAVYFAPNTDQGFIDAITTAVHDTTNQPSVISISWGGPESTWTQQALTALDAACQSAAALGISITAASGDNGSSDGGTGNNVDFPASSPHVLACGGTTLVASGSTLSSETVWNETAQNEGATGGGVSAVFPLPSWQVNANVPAAPTSAGGRGVPDVAGDADPTTGYTIRVDGQTIVIGGTSAVAPLWAGLLAVANQQLGTSVGLIQPAIYAAKAAAAFNDIVSGDNGAFAAGPGWDACTGLGSPIASKLIPLLAPVANKGPVKSPTKGPVKPPTKGPVKPTEGPGKTRKPARDA